MSPCQALPTLSVISHGRQFTKKTSFVYSSFVQIHHLCDCAFFVGLKKVAALLPKEKQHQTNNEGFFEAEKITEGFTVQTWISSGRRVLLWMLMDKGRRKTPIPGRVPKKKYRRCWDDVFVFFFHFF